MRTIKNLFLIVISLFAAQFAHAQTGSMKDPVSFKLKNGLTIIVAQNTGISKVYANFKSEDDAVKEAEQEGLQNLVTGLFNSSEKETNGKINEAKAYNSNQIDLSKAYLTIAGNISPSEAKAIAQKAFGDWKGNTTTESSK
ncbi:hypothetical protein [Pedobacter sp.]|jgi:predicted Zn-dependent peptidase|uniref:hypothetical protein n=1 Tax=Pedobacter sp. TaxID=1411316 RepID=UPI002B8453D6|nr:hypothetical protein [Pedobacter sp.]HWW40926.1 hypothetical protein [Pedobacter sp.]